MRRVDPISLSGNEWIHTMALVCKVSEIVSAVSENVIILD